MRLNPVSPRDGDTLLNRSFPERQISSSHALEQNIQGKKKELEQQKKKKELKTLEYESLQGNREKKNQHSLSFMIIKAMLYPDRTPTIQSLRATC